MKKGRLHDEHCEEIEVHMDRNEFENLERLFLTLGFEIEIKWFRKRNEYLWDGVTVCLDHTYGYGYIIELEKMTNAAEQEKVYMQLEEKLASLHIPKTSREEFDRRFAEYQKNWKSLVEAQD